MGNAPQVARLLGGDFSIMGIVGICSGIEALALRRAGNILQCPIE
ncbi:MAG: hypothetical protein AB7T07_10630 [Steroidobacteraceae bacterium]